VLEPEVIAEPVEVKPEPKIEARGEKVPEPVEAVKPAGKEPTKAETATQPAAAGPAPKVVARPKTVAKPKTGLSAWAVQVGSFGSKKNAYDLRDKLRKQGFSAFVDTLYTKDIPTFRVRVGPEIKREQAEDLQAKLDKLLKARTIVVKHP
jgi:DedD protein